MPIVDPPRIRATHRRGQYTLSDGCPWFTPEAIWDLSKWLNMDMRVLEFGAGGSTVFYAERCREVVTFETDPGYFKEVQARLRQGGICNVRLLGAEGMDDLLAEIAKFEPNSFDVVSIDSAPRVTVRRDLCIHTAPLVKVDGALVLDNYNQHGPPELHGFTAVDYPNPHWYGKGTRIYIHGAGCNQHILRGAPSWKHELSRISPRRRGLRRWRLRARRRRSGIGGR